MTKETKEGKFTELLNAAQNEKTKARKKEASLLNANLEAEDDPVVNLNLKVPRSVRERITISARELHMSNKDLIIKAVNDYVDRAKSKR